MMKHNLKVILVAAFTIIMIVSPFHTSSANAQILGRAGNTMTKAICDLKFAESRLWIDHVLWTRSFIVSDLANLEDKADVLARLMKNQDDIGNSIKPYYGEESGNKLISLLHKHIALAGQVVEAAKTGNNEALQHANQLWYKNADDIAKFLSSINPKLSEKVLRDMLHIHLQLITDQVTARLQGEWSKDIEAFDKGENHMIKFAEILVIGIIAQFPEKFK